MFRRFLSVSTVSSNKAKLYTVYNVTITEILEKGYFLYFVPLLFQFYFINVLNLILLYHVLFIYYVCMSIPFLIISIVSYSYFFFISNDILYYFA